MERFDNTQLYSNHYNQESTNIDIGSRSSTRRVPASAVRIRSSLDLP